MPQLRDSLEVTSLVLPPSLLLSIKGELDLSTIGRLEPLPNLPLDDVDRVQIDLTDLTFCDVSGIGALVSLRLRHEHAGRRVSVTGVSRTLLRVAQLVGVEHLFAK